jgi:hypothetical protein
MPNRTIKESICISETIDQLSPEEERLFYRLIINCEDFGRMPAKAEIVKSKCFPLKVDKISTQDIEKWIMGLVDAGLIVLYEHNGKTYLQFITWDDHQQRRADKPKYPGPDDDGSILISSDINCNQGNTDSLGDPYISKDRNTKDRNTKDRNTKDRNTNTSDSKNKYAEFVRLTEEEYQKLVDKFGENLARDKIEDLNLWKGSKGKKTASDYLTILNWDRKEQKQVKNNGNSRPNTNQPGQSVNGKRFNSRTLPINPGNKRDPVFRDTG